jgi:hypothetical protein
MKCQRMAVIKDRFLYLAQMEYPLAKTVLTISELNLLVQYVAMMLHVLKVIREFKLMEPVIMKNPTHREMVYFL